MYCTRAASLALQEISRTRDSEEMSGEALAVNDSSTRDDESRDDNRYLHNPLICNTSVPVGDRPGVECQPITLLIGDVKVRLLPKYRRGRRLFYCADSDSVRHETGQACDNSAGSTLLSQSNFPLVTGENMDGENRHTITSEDQLNCVSLVDKCSSLNRCISHKSMIGHDLLAVNLRLITTTDQQDNMGRKTFSSENVADRKQTVAATSRQQCDSAMRNKNTVFETRSSGTSPLKDEMEVLQRSSAEFIDGNVMEATAQPTSIECDNQTVLPPFTVDKLPGYAVCYSETEQDDEDICRGKSLLLNDVKSEAEVTFDDPRCRKQVTHVGRRRRVTMAISQRLKLDSAAVRRRCDPYEVSRKVIGFLASTVGLTCLLVGYTALGGWLFVRLEGQNAGRVQSNMRTTRTQFTEKLWMMTERLNVLHHDNWTQQAEQIMDEYASQVYLATKRQGWDGTNKDEVEVKTDAGEETSEQWSYAGALLYSITVITTIGRSRHVLTMSCSLNMLTYELLMRAGKSTPTSPDHFFRYHFVTIGANGNALVNFTRV